MFQKKKISQEEFNHNIAQHELWLNSGHTKGKTYTANNIDFTELDFSKVKRLIGANLVKCSFCHLDLSGINFESINFSDSIFYYTNFSNTVLRRADFKFCEVNSETNFTNANIDEMIVDNNTFEELKDLVTNPQVLQIYDKYSYDVVLEYRDEKEKYLVQRLAQTFVEFAQKKHSEEGLSSSFIDKRNRVIYTIHSTNEETKVALQKVGNTFSEYVKNRATVEDLTDSPALQDFVTWSMQSLVVDYNMRGKLIDRQTLELAEKHNKIVNLDLKPYKQKVLI